MSSTLALQQELASLTKEMPAENLVILIKTAKKLTRQPHTASATSQEQLTKQQAWEQLQRLMRPAKNPHMDYKQEYLEYLDEKYAI